jgi:hypothetical protein
MEIGFVMENKSHYHVILFKHIELHSGKHIACACHLALKPVSTAAYQLS